MTAEWRLRECVNQMLLYVAFRSREAITGVASKPECPDPLAPADAFVKPHAEKVAKLLAGDPKNPKNKEAARSLMEKSRGIIGDPRYASRVERAATWKVGDVVKWWIRAGVAADAWRRAVKGAPQNSREHQATWCLDDAIKRFDLEDDEVWAPMWLLDHVQHWSLAKMAGWDPPEAWDSPAVSVDECHRHLLEWCGDPRRDAGRSTDRAGDAAGAERWAMDHARRYEQFARVALRLCRVSCRYGRLSDSAGVASGWRIWRAPGAPPSVFAVLRPPLHRRSDVAGPPLVGGWIVAPPPAALVAEWWDAAALPPAAPATVIRALERAADTWGADDETFGPLPPWARVEAAAGDARGAARRLAALGSLLTAVEITPSRPPGAADDELADKVPREPRGRLRLALLLEGFAVVPASIRAAGPERVIPVSASRAAGGQDPTPLGIRSSGSDHVVELGVIGPPARCPDELLAAVEELDWRWWALRAVATGAAGPLAPFTGEPGWEAVKRGLLEVEIAGADAERTLVTAFEWLHGVRLNIERLAGTSGADPAVSWITEAIGTIERVICRLPAGCGRGVAHALRPPRTIDAGIDLAAWMATPHGVVSPGAVWDLDWQPCQRPFGQPCHEEAVAATRFRAVFSLGDAAPEETLRLLALPGVITRAGTPWDAFAAPVRRAVHAAIEEGTVSALSAGLAGARAVWSGDAAAAFDEVVGLAVAGNARAGEWIRLVHGDQRFGFACHPPIEVDSETVRLRAPDIEDDIAWRDDDATPVDQDVEVRFATLRGAAVRVLSRGRPAPASAEACAARIVALVAGGPASLVTAAAALQSATDRRRTFSSPLTIPLGIAVEVADALAAAGTATGEAGSRVFDALLGWCRATGTRLVPGAWHPTAGIDRAALAVERVEFHPAVPADRVVVERFGASTADGETIAEPQAYVSAGAAPDGFTEVALAAWSVVEDGDTAGRFRRCVADFPRRVLAGQAPTAAAGLFEVGWKALLENPERADLVEAIGAVQRFLDHSFQMVEFKPVSLDEYKEAWIRDRDGRAPRGRHIERLLRPGLRKLDNSLVYPAIVETG